VEDPLYVGIGGNVGDVPSTIAAAIDRMRALPFVSAVRVSSLWKSMPVGPVQAQPWFVNACAELTLREPVAPAATQIMSALLEIERELGRDRSRERAEGPRPIDLDLLLWGARVLSDPGPPRVAIPHPRLAQRAFALEPLVELAGPDVVIPVDQRRAGELVAALRRDPAQRVRLLQSES
jgi:2-amino-4-hydroxy-6-hydroxymethyldihydropteridine diphosphokinase